MLEVEFEFGFNFPDWHRDALCQEHPELDWFPDKGQSSSQAKAICARCLVQSECLAWALDEGPTLLGVWGGTSQRERKELTKSGKVTGELVRKYGPHAIAGQRAEREAEIDAAVARLRLAV